MGYFSSKSNGLTLFSVISIVKDSPVKASSSALVDSSEIDLIIASMF